METKTDKRPWRVTIGITLEREVLDAVKQLAKDSDRSVSRYINLILREHLKEVEELKALES